MFEKKKRKNFKFIALVLILIAGYLTHVIYVAFAHNPSFELLSMNTISYSGLKAKINPDNTRISLIKVSLGTEDENIYKIYEDDGLDKKFKEKIIDISFSPNDEVIKFIKKNNLKSLYLYYTINYENKFFDSSLEKKIKISIDFEPPKIKNIKTDSYVYIGGIGYVTYETSIDTFRSYVDSGLNEKFYPISIKTKNDIRNLVFFTCGNSKCKNGKIKIVAEDYSGNSVIDTKRIKTIFNKKWAVSDIKVDFGFVKNKYNEIFGTNIISANMENFLELNDTLRSTNNNEITLNTKGISTDILPLQRFYQMKNSEVFSDFSEIRNYYINDSEAPLMTTFHWGYDLASVENAEIYSSSNGIVSYINSGLGIYGKTVIVNHGLGFYTLYSHLSQIDVKIGDSVNNKTVIGRSGETGLAYGDHLHFGTYIQGVPFDSNEIWDKKYFKQKVINIYNRFIDNKTNKDKKKSGI